jgi:hypothetical protein
VANIRVFKIWDRGEERLLTLETARERAVSLAAAVRGLDEAEQEARKSHLAKQVEFGAFVVQIRSQLDSDETFLDWIKESKLGHFQKVYAAIGLAEQLASIRGLLDKERLRAAIDAYNEAAPRLGYLPLKPESESVRTAEVALGMRPGRVAGREADPQIKFSGAPETRSRGMTVAAIDAMDDEIDAISGTGSYSPVGNGSLARAGTAEGFSAPAARAGSGVAGRSAGESRDALPAAGENARDAGQGPAPRETGRATPAARRTPGRDIPGQMGLDEEYANAAAIGERVVEMLRSHAVSPELMRRFVALAAEAGVPGPSAEGGA